MLSLLFSVVLETPVDRIFQDQPLTISLRLQRQSQNQSVYSHYSNTQTCLIVA